MILITGGAGFIGSALVRYVINNTTESVVNVDVLTYSGNLENLSSVSNDSRYHFENVNICDENKIKEIFFKYKPTKVVHLAAESHVDRSIDGPKDFIQTNIFGTYNLLEAAREFFYSLTPELKKDFRFHHVSTDEVYGDLHGTTDLFTEKSPYEPSSPYSASKASSDHLVRAWHRTYGLPVLITNCSNNYGPFHFPEKLIPLVILNALEGKKLPVYGDGNQIRDWLYVQDHARALYTVATKGKVGETYNIGGFNEKKNIEVVRGVCAILDCKRPNKYGLKSYSDLIAFVKDRPGHDHRYAVDASKINKELDWSPEETFESGLEKTVEWFLQNEQWLSHVKNGSYRVRKGLN